MHEEFPAPERVETTRSTLESHAVRLVGQSGLEATTVAAELGIHCGDRVTIECLLRAFRVQATELAGDDEFVRRMRIINPDPQLREELQVGRSRIRDLLSTEIARYEGAKPGLRTDALASTTIAIVSAGTDAWIENRASSRPVADYIDDATQAVLGGDA